MHNEESEVQSLRRTGAVRLPDTTLPPRRSGGILRTLLLLLVCPAMGIAHYSIDWASIDGGGGTSTRGVYTVSGTIGQPDAGTLTGGNFALSGGFWSLVAVIQTPGAPLLSIIKTNDFVMLSWPLAGAAFSLEQSASLPGTWNLVTNAQGHTNDSEILAAVPIGPGSTFFRLHRR